jgi:hypothetical protein
MQWNDKFHHHAASWYHLYARMIMCVSDARERGTAVPLKWESQRGWHYSQLWHSCHQLRLVSSDLKYTQHNIGVSAPEKKAYGLSPNFLRFVTFSVEDPKIALPTRSFQLTKLIDWINCLFWHEQDKQNLITKL